MAQPVIQASFNTGEWAPALNARVDIQKYHSAAALLENFFVDYRGGASTRPGTKYILQAYKSATDVRLIPFQASFTVGYILEFGDAYIRFINNGAYVLETAITGGTGASGHTFTIANTLSPGDWVKASGWTGLTNVNGNYYIVATAAAGNITVTDLFGATPVFTGTWTSGGQLERVYTIASPYAAADLAKVKFAQNVTSMVLCHPSYVPYVLTLITAANWTMTTVGFGSSVAAPTGVTVTTTLAAGSANYSYVVTSVDINGQESAPTAPVALTLKTDLRTVAGTNTISWTAATGAQSYNVYAAEITFDGAGTPAGANFGFIGNCTGVSLADSNIGADFSITPPIPQNPFQGAGVATVTVGTAGTYTTVPAVTLTSAPAGGSTATAAAVLGATAVIIDAGFGGGTGYVVGNSVSAGHGTVFIVATVDGGGAILNLQPLTYPGSNVGSITFGSTPANPVALTGGAGSSGYVDVTWGVVAVNLTSAGAGYTIAPTPTFFPLGAAGATTLANSGTNNNPAAVTFFQQRMVLANTPTAVQTFYMSQTGSPYNFDISSPIQADDAITGSIVSGQLNEIKSMVSVPTGLMVLTSQANWLVNGGASQVAITPSDATANAHSYIGASDVPPIVSNFDILFVQAKGSIVRDLTYNFYANIFTGADITILSSHLFYGYTIEEWAWAQEPFKVVWAVRNDGVMLTLTFLKEQEFIGWTHNVTAGLFTSVATVTEAVSQGSVDAVYTVVQRVINGSTVKYIERVAERIFPVGPSDAWCVDAGIQYSGAPATSFSGAQHLAGATVTGLADGVVIPPFVMPVSGAFTLPSASKVTIGLAYTCKLQTLAIDTGEPTIQGKVKKIPAVTVRVADTLGLKIGSSFSRLVAMKDLVVGAIGSMLTGQETQTVSGLFTGDARTILDPTYTVPGQYCIQQDQPFPASVLGVIPQITVGDTK
jgi:hypothetical protein